MKTVSIIYPSPFWLRPQSIATRAVCCLAARDLSPSSWDWSFPHARILDPRLVQSSYFRLIYFPSNPLLIAAVAMYMNVLLTWSMEFLRLWQYFGSSSVFERDSYGSCESKCSRKSHTCPYNFTSRRLSLALFELLELLQMGRVWDLELTKVRVSFPGLDSTCCSQMGFLLAVPYFLESHLAAAQMIIQINGYLLSNPSVRRSLFSYYSWRAKKDRDDLCHLSEWGGSDAASRHHWLLWYSLSSPAQSHPASCHCFFLIIHCRSLP